MRGDHLVPKFYAALLDIDQKHVVQILGHKDLHTFVTVFTMSPREQLCASQL